MPLKICVPRKELSEMLTSDQSIAALLKTADKLRNVEPMLPFCKFFY